MASERNGVPDSSSQRGARGERLLKAGAPGEILAEVVRLVDDHQRVRRDLRRPAARVARHARVGHGHAVEVARRARARRRRAAAARRAPPPRSPTGASAASSGRGPRRGRPRRCASSRLASSSAGRVLPAPGAAEIRNGPSRQPASRSSARALPGAQGCRVGERQRARHPATCARTDRKAGTQAPAAA